MISATARQLSMLRNALQRIFSPPLAGALNIAVFGIALSLPAGMYVLLQNAQGAVAGLAGSHQISLFMDMNAAVDQVSTLRKRLLQHPGIASVELVPRDRALEQLKESTGLADVIAGLEKNPLPDAFVVHPHKDEVQALEAMRAELARLPGVEVAQLDSAWAYKLEALLKFGRTAVLILAALLSFALVAITFNTIRLQILTRREEIEVSKLIGATNSFIRRPFLFFGALQGLLGGMTAWLIVTIGLLLLNLPLGELSELYGSQFTLSLLPADDSITLVLFSMCLGWAGAWLSVTRHLSRIEQGN